MLNLFGYIQLCETMKHVWNLNSIRIKTHEFSPLWNFNKHSSKKAQGSKNQEWTGLNSFLYPNHKLTTMQTHHVQTKHKNKTKHTHKVFPQISRHLLIIESYVLMFLCNYNIASLSNLTRQATRSSRTMTLEL